MFCTRCGTDNVVDNIGKELVHFVCVPCRTDKNVFESETRDFDLLDEELEETASEE